MVRRMAVATLLFLGACGSDSIAPQESVLLEIWGTASDDPGFFVRPMSVAIDPAGNILVADAGLDRIQRLDSSGRPLDIWPLPVSPTSIDVAPDGTIAIGANSNSAPGAQLLLLDPSGSVLWQRTVEDPERTVFGAEVAVGNFVAALTRREVKVYSRRGEQLYSWSANGSSIDMREPGVIDLLTDGGVRRHRPDGVVTGGGQYIDACFSPYGDLFDIDAAGRAFYYTDFCPSDPSGELRALRNGRFDVLVPLAIDQRPRGLEVSDDGQVLLLPRFSRHLLRAALDQGRLKEVAQIGARTKPGVFDQPLALAADSKGRIAILDAGNRRVQVMNRRGGVESITELSFEPRALAYDAQDRLLVASRRAVYRYEEAQLTEEIRYVLGPHAVSTWVGEVDGQVLLGFGGSILAPGRYEPLVQTYDESLTIAAAVSTGKALLVVVEPLEGSRQFLRLYNAEGEVQSTVDLQLDDVTALALGDAGTLYASGASGVWQINLDGSVLRAIDLPGQAAPISIAARERLLSALDAKQELVYRLRL